MKKHKTQIYCVASGVLGFLLACMIQPLLETRDPLELKKLELELRTNDMRMVKHWRGYQNTNGRHFKIDSDEWVLTWKTRSLSAESVFSIEVLDGNDGRIAHVGFTTTSDAGFTEFQETNSVSIRITCIDQIFEVSVWIPSE